MTSPIEEGTKLHRREEQKHNAKEVLRVAVDRCLEKGVTREEILLACDNHIYHVQQGEVPDAG